MEEVTGMATQSASFTVEFETYAADLVKSGRYSSAGEVLRAAIDALRREESDDAAKMEALEQALEEGFASGVAEGDVFARVRQRAGLPPRVR
jgi:antitoxin ParD1/3/4